MASRLTVSAATRSRNIKIGAGMALFVTAMAVLPIVFSTNRENLSLRERPLAGQATVRG